VHIPKTIQWFMLFLAGILAGWQAHRHWSPDGPERRDRPHQAEKMCPPPHPGAPKTRPTRSVTKALETLLRQKDYEKAVALFATPRSDTERAKAEDIKAGILRYAAALATEGDPAEAARLLTLFLQQAYRDPEALELLARVYAADHQYLSAITTWYEARSLAYRPDHLKRITERIRAIVDEYTQVLEEQGNEQALLELYLKLTELEPDYPPYFIGLAKAQLAMGDEAGARESLQLVADDPEIGTQAGELLATLEPPVETSQDTEGAIPLTPAGNQFLVDVWVNEDTQLRLLIDTGASLTVITPEALEALGIELGETARRVRVNTAGGPVEAPVLRIDSLAVGDYKVSSLDAGVIELPDMPDVDGLLGMNFLRHFQFFIDQHEHQLRLSPKP